MQALVVPAAGAQPILSEIATPKAGPGTVVIKVEVGRGAAGTVVAVGQGVTDIAIGDHVIGHIALTPPIQHGTIAEYALLPAESVSPKPAGIDFVQAAALPLAGGAAVAAVDAIGAKPAEKVLVVDASGGVGSYAVQLLAARGAVIIATGTATDVERLTRLGAHQVVDHTSAPVPEQVRASHPEGVDALLEMVSFDLDGLLANAHAVRPGGRVTSTTNVGVTMPDHMISASSPNRPPPAP